MKIVNFLLVGVQVAGTQYKNSKTGSFLSRLLLLFTCLFISRGLIAQTHPGPVNTRNFLNNIVEIGLRDFGLVTGEDSTHIYFIAVRHTQPEKDRGMDPVAKSI